MDETILQPKKHKLRIIINTNAPYATSGYATQGELLVSRIHNNGYPIAYIDFYGLEGGKVEINGIRHYPKIGSAWGDDALLMHGNDWNTDISFTLQDIWTLNPEHLKKIKRWIPILPVDHDPIPWPIFERARLAYRIITYSKFGHKQLEDRGLYSTYIPHAVDCEIFKNYNKRDEIRKELRIPPDVFLFGMVSANKDNPPRKSFQQCIDAYKIFHDKYPNSGMYFHTIIEQQGGFPIQNYWNFLNLPKDKIFFIPPYDLIYHVGRPELAKIYNTFDVLLCPSTNEGFGVPIIEAQACEIPVIVNNWTAMPELVVEGKTGYIVKNNYKWYTPMGSYAAFPDTTDIYNGMIELYKADRVAMGKTCREFILDNYDINKVYKEKWQPLLERLENEIYPQT